MYSKSNRGHTYSVNSRWIRILSIFVVSPRWIHEHRCRVQFRFACDFVARFSSIISEPSGQRKHIIGDLRKCATRCGGDGDAFCFRGDLPPLSHPHHRLFLVSDSSRSATYLSFFFFVSVAAYILVRSRIYVRFTLGGKLSSGTSQTEHVEVPLN